MVNDKSPFKAGEFSCPQQCEVRIALHELVGPSTVCKRLRANLMNVMAVEYRSNLFVYSEKVRRRGAPVALRLCFRQPCDGTRSNVVSPWLRADTRR